MQTSVIRHRVADFLKQYPPFDALSEPDLLEAAGSGKVKFHQADEFVFRQGHDKPQVIWMVQQGRVDIIDETASGSQLRDILGEGDLLGVDGFLGDGVCAHSARTASDVILYGVNADLFASFIPRYPHVKRYLRAHFSVSSLPGTRRTSWLDAEAPPADFLRARLVAVPAGASNEEVRFTMKKAGTPVVAFVGDSQIPVGMLTAADLATIPVGSSTLAGRPWAAAMAAPITTRAAVRALLASRGDAIAMTADGTLNSPLEGILTAEELALFSGHNPVRLISAIRNASSTAEIPPLVKQARRVVLDGLAEPNHVDDCSRIGAEISFALAESCLRHAHDHVAALGIRCPSVPWAWFVFGAGGRNELLEPHFPAMAAIYGDVPDAAHAVVNDYFESMAKAVESWCMDCGIIRPDSEWWMACKSVSEWKQFYGGTIRDPIQSGLYTRREMFDLAPLSGNTSLIEELQNEIRARFREDELTTALLANDTLANLPPLTFFRGLVVELDGVQHESVDVQITGLAPIGDAARVFAVVSGQPFPSGTLDRLQRAADAFPQGEPVFADAAEAFRIIQYYRSLSDTPSIVPSRLGKFDQRLLKTAFASVQRLLEFTDATLIPRG